MSEAFIHNPNLPLPKDILPLNPRAVMIDGVEEVEMGRAVGFWTPNEDFCFPLVTGGTPLLSTAVAGEVFNQLASYVLLHGRKEPRIPYMTGADRLSWRHPVLQGETIGVQVDIALNRSVKKEYTAEGQLLKAGEIACRGVVSGVLLEPGEEWFEREPEHRQTAPQTRPARPEMTSGLYAALVGLDQIPKIKTRAPGPKVVMSVEDDNTIKLNENVISLQSHRLFLMNALLLNLGRPIIRREVEELGFAPGVSYGTRQVAFSKAKTSLKESLVYGEPPKRLLLQKNDSSKTGYYQLDPKVEYEFFDRRQHS